MTLRNSDLQSVSDLDSICNSCDVFSTKMIKGRWVDERLFIWRILSNNSSGWILGICLFRCWTREGQLKIHFVESWSRILFPTYVITPGLFPLQITSLANNKNIKCMLVTAKGVCLMLTMCEIALNPKYKYNLPCTCQDFLVSKITIFSYYEIRFTYNYRKRGFVNVDADTDNDNHFFNRQWQTCEFGPVRVAVNY